ncbi:MAG: T9SS type A sorting domain-containing protein [Bacteroidota bacterium]
MKLLYAAFFITLLFYPCAAFCQYAPLQLPFDTDGPVKTIVRDGNTIFIGGDFKSAGRTTGHCTLLNLQNGKQLLQNYPYVKGDVLTSLPDGQGGWYIGGSFTQIGNSSKSYFARLKPDLSLDSSFAPQVRVPIVKMVQSGSRIFIVDSTGHIGAVKVTTGFATNWNPVLAGGKAITLTSAGSVIYIGGTFTSVNGQSRSCVAAVDTISGEPFSWNPLIKSTLWPYTLRINCIVSRKGKVYIGGVFDEAGTLTRYNLASFDSVSGSLQIWNPAARMGAEPKGVSNVMSEGKNSMYLAGELTTNSSTYNYTIAVDFVSGIKNDWQPDFGYSSGHAEDILEYEDKVYILRSFSDMTPPGYCQYILTTDTLVGYEVGWRGDFNGRVRSINIGAGKMFACGDFTIAQQPTRYGLAAFDANTGALKPWNPRTNGYVDKILLDNGKLYIGGYFTVAANEYRNSVACIDTSTGYATDFRTAYDMPVTDMCITGDKLFIGYMDNNINLGALVTVNKVTGALTPDQIRLGPSVSGLEAAGNTLFVSGGFIYRDPLTLLATRTRLAAFNVETGSPTAFNPLNSNVYYSSFCLADGKVYTVSSSSSFPYCDSSYSCSAVFDTATGAQLTCATLPNIGTVINNCDGALFIADTRFPTRRNPVSGYSVISPQTCNELAPRQINKDYYMTFAGYGNIVYAGGAFYKNSNNEPDRNCFVMLQNPYGLSGTAAKVENKSAALTLYPNPAYDRLFIKTTPNSKSSPVFMNTLGQTISLPITHSAEGWEVNISSLATGIYFVRSGATSQKFVKK